MTFKINVINKIMNLKRLVNNRLFAICIVMIIATGCAHDKRSSCFEAFGGSILWNKYFTFKFDDNFKQNGSPKCTRNENFALFSLGIGILDEKIKYQDGNSAVMLFSLNSFAEKLSAEQINYAVNSPSKKYLSEVKNLDKNDPRFSYIDSKIGHLVEDKDKICRVFMTSVKDRKARNIPSNQQYVIQNDLYKTCFLKNYNQVVTLTSSYRIIPSLEKIFWQQDVIDKLNLVSLNIIMNDGRPLASIFNIKQQEIFNLK